MNNTTSKQLPEVIERKLRLLLDETIEDMESYIEEDGKLLYSDALFCRLFDQLKPFIAQELHTLEQKLESVYVLTAYDNEKERLGEIIVVNDREEAFDIEKKLQETYGVKNVTFASRKVNDIPEVLSLTNTKEQNV